MRTRLGTPKAITAAAHELARVIYHLLATRQAYEESVFVRCEALHQQRLENRIRRQARGLASPWSDRQRDVFLGTASKRSALEYRNHSPLIEAQNPVLAYRVSTQRLHEKVRDFAKAEKPLILLARPEGFEPQPQIRSQLFISLNVLI